MSLRSTSNEFPMVFTTLISAEQLAQHLNDPGWIIFDCRFTLSDDMAGYRAYLKGHIPGARYAHLNNDLSAKVTTPHRPSPIARCEFAGKKTR